MTGWEDSTHTCNITILGNPTVLATQSVSSAIAPVPATNTRGSVTLPAAAYAVNEPLLIGSSLAWVTLHPSSLVDNVTNFVGQDGTVNNPSGGETLKHLSLVSPIGNVTVRSPAGFHFQIINCTINGEIVAESSQNQPQSIQSGAFPEGQLIINQCALPHGAKGSGPVTYVNCLVNGVIGNPGVVPGRWNFAHCTFINDVNLNSGNVVLSGSTTFNVCGLNLIMSQVVCIAAGGKQDISTWGLNSVANFLQLVNSTMMLNFATLWGHMTSGNQIINVESGLVTYQSATPPVATGATFDLRIGGAGSGGRIGTFSELPVMAPLVPAGIVFEDSSSGTEGRNSYGNFSGSTGVVNIFPAIPKKGLYIIYIYIAILVPATTGTGGVIVAYTDDSVATTKQPISSFNMATLGEADAIVQIECNGTVHPTYQIVVSALTGPLSYSLRMVAEKKSSGS